MTTQRPTRGPKNLWPLGIILALAGVVTINIIMVTIAIKHPSVPETDKHWEESLAFNQEYALREQSLQKGWRLSVRPCAALQEDGACQLQIQILDTNNQPVPALKGTVRVRRGDHTESDREVPLLTQDQNYIARFSMGRRGMYTIQVTSGDEQGAWRGSRRLSIEPLPFLGQNS